MAGVVRPRSARPGAGAGPRLHAHLRHGLRAAARPRPRRVGLGDGLPRAGPVDAVVAAVPRSCRARCCRRWCCSPPSCWRCGAGRLAAVSCRGPRGPAATVAAAAYVWNPYVAERLLLGHWALLVPYAALPWLVTAAHGARGGDGGSLGRLVVLLGAVRAHPDRWAARRPGGGMRPGRAPAGVVGRRDRLGRARRALVGPRPPPRGAAAARARTAGWPPSPSAARGCWARRARRRARRGWNAAAVPGSRETVLGGVATVVLLGAAALGVPLLRRSSRRGTALRLAAAAASGLGLALAGATPGPATWPGSWRPSPPRACCATGRSGWPPGRCCSRSLPARAWQGWPAPWPSGSCGSLVPATARRRPGGPAPRPRVGRVRPARGRRLPARVVDGCARPWRPAAGTPWCCRGARSGDSTGTATAPSSTRRAATSRGRWSWTTTSWWATCAVAGEGRRAARAEAALAGPDPAGALRRLGVRWVLVHRDQPGLAPTCRPGARSSAAPTLPTRAPRRPGGCAPAARGHPRGGGRRRAGSAAPRRRGAADRQAW